METGYAPYFELIQQDISDRQTWNNKDNLILKRRLGERPKTSLPYPGAPNPVVNIIDDNTSQRTDVEISMIMNSPKFAYFLPIGGTEQKLASQAQQGFDTLLRHFMNYRSRKEQSVDTKNARGFSIDKVIREEHVDIPGGVLPAFETIDPKDIIVPSNSKCVQKLERIAHVIRMSRREFEDTGKPVTERNVTMRGWKHTEKILERLQESSGSSDDSYNGDEDNTISVTERLIGINASNFRDNQIVVWEVAHYATEWDVKNAPSDIDLKVGERCLSYIAPDVPNLLLKIRPWRLPDIIEELSIEDAEKEIIAAVEEDREPVLVRTTRAEGVRPWPYIQHRFENRSPFWYDSRGIGHLVMDNHLTATGLKRRKMIYADYTTNPMFENSGDGVQEANFRFRPGGVMPKGLTMAQLPQAPASMDFDIDQEKREAGQRSGAGNSQFSGQAQENRKLQKSATEVNAEMAIASTLSSASVDRFNDADRELFRQIWEECAKLEIELPIIEAGKPPSVMSKDAYQGKYVIVPAASEKTINPDVQAVKNQQLLDWAAQYIPMGVPIDIAEGVQHVMDQANSNLSAVVSMDPTAEGPQGQPPIYQTLQQIVAQLSQTQQIDQEQAQNIEAIGKLAMENSQQIEKLDSQDEGGGEDGIIPLQ
tara:strand:+ start:1363 stop:3312 length:1950 start_codon:yes stop_codon:yes gene_type:complete